MFVTLEGIDRSGKTTQAKLLAEALGAGTVLLREPGGTPAGERVRELLKDAEVGLAPRAELLLFAAARAELCERVIAPALAAGRDVVCDRFIDSTAAYQGRARGLGLDLVDEVNRIAIGGCVPDRTVLLRVAPERARARAGDDGDRFESEGVELQRAVAAAYDELAARHPQRIAVVDAEAEPAAVHAAVMRALEPARGRAGG